MSIQLSEMKGSLRINPSTAHSNNSSAAADKLFECVWPFFGIGALMVSSIEKKIKIIRL